MNVNIACWWHGTVLRHRQDPVMNGRTEPGVWCKCPLDLRRTRYRWRWFPSDGGGGR